jgi:predicted dehydrogenase
MNMKKLRVGIVGYGVVGRRRKECVIQHPDMELVAVCDKNLPSNEKTNEKINFYRSYKELLNERLDVLIVCLTNDIAPKVTILGLEKGFHVFCEKPPGKNVTDIHEVINVERKNPGLKLMYGFNHRYHDSVIEALSIIKSNKLGKVVNLRGVYGKSQLITFNQSDWRTRREASGGGVLLDQGIHMVDLMRLFSGEFTKVYSFIENSFWNYNVEDNAYALMRTDDGKVAMLNSSATQWRHRFYLDVNLEKGSLILGGILSGSKSYGAETLTVVSANPEGDKGDPKEVTTRYNTDPSWYAEIKEFVDCILKNRKVINGSSNDALQTMKLVYKIYYADKKWRQAYDIKDPDTE